MCAHHKEVDPVKNGFLLGAEKQLATLGAVNDEDNVVFLAEAGNGLQREDPSTLTRHLEDLKSHSDLGFPTWSQSRTENS